MDLNPSNYVGAIVVTEVRIRQLIEESTGLRDFHPEFALTLGSGLGELAKNIKVLARFDYYEDIGFPKLNVQGHAGQMLVGYLCGVPIIGLSGRKHYYEVASEPYGMLQVVFPVHVMACLGAKVYFATNAVGGLNAAYRVGDLMIIKDHIDLFMPDPLVGEHFNFGEGFDLFPTHQNLYFQPQHNQYDKELSRMFTKAARDTEHSGRVHTGIYVARTGRTYETAATSQALRLLGADAVGMSVIPEIIVANNRGMKTMAVSIITNKVAPDGTNATSHEEVTAILNSQSTKDRLNTLFTEFFRKYYNDVYKAKRPA